MIREMKSIKEIVVHLETGHGYYVTGNNLIEFYLSDLETEDVAFIIATGRQVRYDFDVSIKCGEIFSHLLDNGWDYEMNHQVELFTREYISQKQFVDMCKRAQRELKREGIRYNDIISIKSKLIELYPETFIKVGCGGVFCPLD